jgi:alpha-glucosidase
MLNFHGCAKPTGERRRWPHNLTREAIWGAEQYKGSPGPTAKYNCILPFTRNVQGPMDYTPVTYSNMGGQMTYAHQTALDVVFESGVQHLADKPSSYTSNTAQPLLKAVPAHWDETKLLEGQPGQYVTIARRSGTSWFIGSIADAARTATVPLSFLGSGMYGAQIYRDGSADTEQIADTQTVSSASVLTIQLRQHGGFGVQLTPQ